MRSVRLDCGGDGDFPNGVAIHYIQPGKPEQNAYIERFNRSYRIEVLKAHLFESVAELQALSSTYRSTTVSSGARRGDGLRPQE